METLDSESAAAAFNTQLEELEANIVKYKGLTGRSVDEGVALTALRNVAMKIADTHKDMKLDPSKYKTYQEMRQRLIEYAGARD